MTMFSRQVIFLSLIVGSLCLPNFSEYVSIVVELTKKQMISSGINAYTCWPKAQKLEFIKVCSKNYIPIRITRIQSVLKFTGPVSQQLSVVDWNCEGAKALLDQAERDGLFRFPTKWIILGSHKNLTAQLRNFFFGIDSKVYVIEKHGNGYSIKMPYKFTKNDTNFIEDNVAVWENGNFLYYNDVTTPQNRSDLMGTPFKASYAFLDPDSINHIYDQRDIHIDTIGKSNYIVVNILMQVLNVTKAPPVFYRSRGYKLNGSSNYGYMMGDLQRNEIDISGTSSLTTLDRMKFQTFLAPGSPTKLIFVFRAPLLPFVANIFAVALDSHVWYASFVMMLMVLLVLYLIVRFECATNRDNYSSQVMRDNIVDVFVNGFEMVAQQGTETEPRSISGRTVLIISVISCMFLYTAFNANIVAVLQSTSESIRTVEDLYTSDIELGAEDLNYERAFFSVETQPLKKALVDEKLKFYSLEKGIERMKNEFFAFHSEDSTVYKIVKESFSPADICRLRQISFFHYPSRPFFSVPLNSTYKELLKYKIYQFHGYGIISREQRRLYAEKPKCLSQGTYGTVGIVECYAAFVIFGVGIGCSFGLFLLEILWKKFKTLSSV